MSKEKQAFLDILKEDRYDSTTRLVFADWLEERGFDDEALEQRRMSTQEWVEADKWMYEFVETIGGDDYELGSITYGDVMRAAQDSLDSKDDDRLVQVGSEYARDEMSNPGIRKRFWEAWRTITGQPLPDEAKDYRVFCCTC